MYLFIYLFIYLFLRVKSQDAKEDGDKIPLFQTNVQGERRQFSSSFTSSFVCIPMRRKAFLFGVVNDERRRTFRIFRMYFLNSKERRDVRAGAFPLEARTILGLAIEANLFPLFAARQNRFFGWEES